MIRGGVLNMSASGALVETLGPISVGSPARIQANDSRELRLSDTLRGDYGDSESGWNSPSLCEIAI